MKSLLFIAIIINLITGCEKKEVLPSMTANGMETFGVKINGKVWLPKKGISIIGTPEKVFAEYSNGTFAITARK